MKLTALDAEKNNAAKVLPYHPPAMDRMLAVIQAEIDAGHIPGAVLTIQRHGGVLCEQAFGLQQPGQPTPMAVDSIFRIYSMTKPVVSVAVLMLAEQGRLLISEPVAKYLPELGRLQVAQEERDPNGNLSVRLVECARPMTIQDLLRHTAGLTYGMFGVSTSVKTAYRDQGIESGRLTNAELVARLGKIPLAYQPGTVWEYSRATDVLGALLERICGQTLDVILREMIFTPLQMPDTGFWVAPEQQHRIAEPFAVDPVTQQKVSVIDVTAAPAFLSGGGGLVSTAKDYLRFARMLLANGALEGVRILSRKSVEFMTSDHLGNLPDATNGPVYLPGPGYGFGLGVAVRNSVGGGYTPGSLGDFHWSGLAGTYFWIDPKEQLIAIWLMQAPEQRDRFRQLIRNLVHASLV